MIETFVNKFIKDKYQERLIFELESKKTQKREKAFIKLLDYEKYFKSEILKIDLSHLTDEEILDRIKKHINIKECYSLYFERQGNVEQTVLNAIQKACLDILIIDENNIIYIGEVYHNLDKSNTSAKFILYL